MLFYSIILLHFEHCLLIHSLDVNHMCKLDPGAHMRNIWLLLKSGVTLVRQNEQVKISLALRVLKGVK